MINNIIRNFNKTIESLLPEIDKEVDELIEYLKKEKVNYFIKKENKDIEYTKKFDNHIEFQLDFLITPFTKKQFDKLLYYWGEFNPESARYYKKLYEEICD